MNTQLRHAKPGPSKLIRLMRRTVRLVNCKKRRASMQFFWLTRRHRV